MLCSPNAGWSSSVARWAHNPEVAGSNPVPATDEEAPEQLFRGLFVSLVCRRIRRCRSRARYPSTAAVSSRWRRRRPRTARPLPGTLLPYAPWLLPVSPGGRRRAVAVVEGQLNGMFWSWGRQCVLLETPNAGWSSSVARWAHNPEVAGSNPVPATTGKIPERISPGSFLFHIGWIATGTRFFAGGGAELSKDHRAEGSYPAWVLCSPRCRIR